MSDAHVDFADLLLRTQQPERWEPPFGSAPLTLRVSGGGAGGVDYSWVAVQLPRGKGTLVREAIVKPAAFARLLGGQKTAAVAELVRDGLVWVRDASVPGDVVTEILTTGAGLLVPVMALHWNDVVDGRRYALSIDSGSCSVRLTWPEKGPTEWHALTAWVRNTRRLLHEMIYPPEGQERAPMLVAATPIVPPEHGKCWAFHVINDSDEPIESVTLESVDVEWGDLGSSTVVGTRFAPIPPRTSVEIHREQATEVTTSVTLRVRERSGERRIEAEVGRLYEDPGPLVPLPILEPLGKRARLRTLRN